MNLLKSAIIVIYSLFAIVGYTQTESDSTKSSKVYKIIKHDGTKYIGKVLSDDGREVLIETEELGKIYIPKSQIESMKVIDESESLVKGNFRESGPFVTRYYFTNNALPVTKGEDYAMIHLYGPEVHFAAAKNLSIGIMASWIASPIGVALKYSIPTANEKINLSLGTIMFSSGYLFNALGWGGLHWGNITYGQAGKNITVGSGFGYVDLVFNERSNNETGLQKLNRGWVSSIGGIAPVGERASFIFDSMIMLSERRNYSYGQINTYQSGTQLTAVLMPGMRFQKYDKRAFQFALAGVIQYSSIGFYNNGQNTSSDVISFPAPMCSWFFKF